MIRNSYASSGVSPTSPERQFFMSERFDVLKATSVLHSQTRLQHQRHRFSIRDTETFVSTAIAPNRWIAAATPSEVRLYDIDSQSQKQNLLQNIKPCHSIHLKPLSKGESIRAVAISNDLLAVVTHLRLMVYSYQEFAFESNIIEEVRIDQKASWTPKSVSILQVHSSDATQSAAAWIAVGGQGVNCVKLYQYSHRSCWEAQSDCRLTLKCLENTGLVQSVGFSSFLHRNCFFVFAVSSENRVLCWEIRTQEIGPPLSRPRPGYNANATRDSSGHKGEITAANIFKSPTGTPYILVAINQKYGSQVMRSFIAPLDTPSSQWRSLPDKVARRQSLSAAATSNGRYVIVAEEGIIKLFTLHGALDGGLACRERSLDWSSPLTETAKGICAISLSVKEKVGCLEVTGIDGRGHVVSAHVSVPGMPETAVSSLDRQLPGQTELHEVHEDSFVPELHGGGIAASQTVRVDSAVQLDSERLAEEIIDFFEIHNQEPRVTGRGRERTT